MRLRVTQILYMPSGHLHEDNLGLWDNLFPVYSAVAPTLSTLSFSLMRQCERWDWKCKIFCVTWALFYNSGHMKFDPRLVHAWSWTCQFFLRLLVMLWRKLLSVLQCWFCASLPSSAFSDVTSVAQDATVGVCTHITKITKWCKSEPTFPPPTSG